MTHENTLKERFREWYEQHQPNYAPEFDEFWRYVTAAVRRTAKKPIETESKFNEIWRATNKAFRYFKPEKTGSKVKSIESRFLMYWGQTYKDTELDINQHDREWEARKRDVRTHENKNAIRAMREEQERRLLHEAVDALPKYEQYIIIARYFQNKAFSEIAEDLKKTKKTVLKHHDQILTKMKLDLTKDW